MRKLRWILIALGALVVVAVGGTWFYIHVIEGPAPKPLSFQGRDAGATTTFTLSQPIGITTVPSDRQEVPLKATGDLTLHGTTKAVTVDLVARRNGGNIEVNGSIPIVFADWGIPNPTFGPASTEDHGVI